MGYNDSGTMSLEPESAYKVIVEEYGEDYSLVNLLGSGTITWMEMWKSLKFDTYVSRLVYAKIK